MKNLVKEPLLHFLLIGAGLFLFFGGKGGPAILSGAQSGPQWPKIVVIQDDIDQLVETFIRTWQRPPTEDEINGMVDSFVRDEIYYREAVAAGLDRDDSVIRRRMRLKMEFIFEDIAAQREPTDEELIAYMKKDPDSYLADPMMAFRHVFINIDKRGQSAEADAQQVLVRLNEGVDPDSVGDSFLLNSETELLPLREIGKQFGKAFSTKLLQLEQGKWQGPVRSGFGLHLVFVTNRIGVKLPQLAQVRDIVRQDWMADRQKELKDAAYAKLRERYRVVVEQPKSVASLSLAEANTGTVNR